MLPTETPEDHGTEEKRPDHFRSAGSKPLGDAFDWEVYDGDLASSSFGPDIDQFPTAPLLAIDQWPTQPMPVLTGEPFSFQHGSFLDMESVEELDLVLHPAIERMTESRPHPSVQQATGAGNYLKLGRKLMMSSGIYGLAQLGYPLVSLVLAPFLTHRLSPDDYGILTVLATVISLAAAVTSLGIQAAFFRSYNYDYTEPRDRRTVLATVVVLLSLGSIPVAIAASLFAPTLAGALFNRPSLGDLITFAAWIVVVQNLTIPGLSWLRAENRPVPFTLLSISTVLIMLCVNLLLVGLLHWGVAGSLLATVSGYGIVAVCTLPFILWHSRLQVRRDVAWSLLTFGVPQVFSYISFWVLQLSDRYLLSLFASLAQAASYAVGYSLGGVVSTLGVAPFYLAWAATMFAVAKRKDAQQVFQIVFRWFSMALLFAAFAISIAGSLVLDVLFPASYRSATPVIPVVAESMVFYGLYVVFMTGASIQRKTWMPAVLSTLAAFLNVALNLVLIPHFGALGAAASTLIAYMVLALVAYLANQRIYPIPYEIRRLLLALLIGVALYIGAVVLTQHWGTSWQWPLAFASLALYGICLLFLGKGTGALRAGGAMLFARLSSDRNVS